MNNDTATIILINAHGRFEVDAKVLDRALDKVGTASLAWVRQEAAGACGHEANAFGIQTAFDDHTKVEAIIAWVESGNHTF